MPLSDWKNDAIRERNCRDRIRYAIKLFISHVDVETFIVRDASSITHIFASVDIKDEIKQNAVYSNIETDRF